MLRSGPTPVSRSGRQRILATGRRLASVIIMCSAYLASTHAVRLLVSCFGLIFGTALGMTGGGKINLPTLPECEPREQLRQILVLQTQSTMGRLRVHSCTIINSIIVNSVTLHGGEVGVSACHSRGSRCLSAFRFAEGFGCTQCSHGPRQATLERLLEVNMLNLCCRLSCSATGGCRVRV